MDEPQAVPKAAPSKSFSSHNFFRKNRRSWRLKKPAAGSSSPSPRNFAANRQDVFSEPFLDFVEIELLVIRMSEPLELSVFVRTGKLPMRRVETARLVLRQFHQDDLKHVSQWQEAFQIQNNAQSFLDFCLD